MKLEFPADATPDFFFIPCDPITHEPHGERVNGTWCVDYDAGALALLFDANKRGKDPETVALYEKAAERLRLYSIIEGNWAHSLDDGVERMIARGKLVVMEKQRETQRNGRHR